MDAVFHILFPALILVLIWAGYAIVRRSNERQAAWRSGLTAQARVVRAYVTVQVVNNIARRIQWHEYDFTTADRRAIRFKESGGRRAGPPVTRRSSTTRSSSPTRPPLRSRVPARTRSA